jgi:hypothetical protein
VRLRPLAHGRPPIGPLALQSHPSFEFEIDATRR